MPCARAGRGIAAPDQAQGRSQRLNGRKMLDRLHGRSCHSPDCVVCEDGNRRTSQPPCCLDALGCALYTSAVQFRRDFHLAWQTTPVGAKVEKIPRASEFRGYHVPTLRIDRQRPDGRPHGEPFQHQDQAPVSAEPVQRHDAVRHARPLGAAESLGQRNPLGRSPRRPRCFPDQGQGRSICRARRSTSSAQIAKKSAEQA